MSIERRWNRNEVSRESPDKEVNRRIIIIIIIIWLGRRGDPTLWEAKLGRHELKR